MLVFRPVGAALFHTDGRTDGQADRKTDMRELIVAFRSSVNEFKNSCLQAKKQALDFYHWQVYVV